jgi:hypothetical protein
MNARQYGRQRKCNYRRNNDAEQETHTIVLPKLQVS